MNQKTILLALLLLVVFSTGVFYLLAHQSQISQPVSPTPTPQATPPSAVIRVPVDFFRDHISGFGIPSSNFVNSSTGAIVSFRLLNDLAHQAPNATFETFVNQKKLGEVGGEEASMAGFSPDNKYFAFRTMLNEGCAGTCLDFGLYVVNLASSSISYIATPRKSSNPTTDAVIESYSWDSDALKITFYFTEFFIPDGGKAVDGKYYRISPKEIWRYDLNTKQYTLVETLPE